MKHNDMVSGKYPVVNAGSSLVSLFISIA